LAADPPLVAAPRYWPPVSRPAPPGGSPARADRTRYRPRRTPITDSARPAASARRCLRRWS